MLLLFITNLNMGGGGGVTPVVTPEDMPLLLVLGVGF